MRCLSLTSSCYFGPWAMLMAAPATQQGADEASTWRAPWPNESRPGPDQTLGEANGAIQCGYSGFWRMET